jgi:hypothetical protein
MRGLLAVVMLVASRALAEGTTTDAPIPPASHPVAVDADHRTTSFSASLFGYFVPENQDYAQPTLAADCGRLHLEARYNYEALQSGSAWLGYTFSAGTQWSMDLTPMLGGVFGDLQGVSPAYELTLGWSKLELYSEGEYVFDLQEESGDFFYNWSELSVSPRDWWRVGLAAQRTRVYESELDVQPGFLAGLSYEPASVTAYVFNLGWEEPTVVISATAAF